MRTLTTSQLKEMQQRGRPFELINVLPGDEFSAVHIPGSKNIPLTNESFVDEVQQTVDDKEREVIVYCASHDCDLSIKAAQKLESAGFTNVYDYGGGTKAWDDAGLPLEGEQAAQ